MHIKSKITITHKNVNIYVEKHFFLKKKNHRTNSESIHYYQINYNNYLEDSNTNYFFTTKENLLVFLSSIFGTPYAVPTPCFYRQANHL